MIANHYVYVAVRIETGELDMLSLTPFKDEMTHLLPEFEWRTFKLVEHKS